MVGMFLSYYDDKMGNVLKWSFYLSLMIQAAPQQKVRKEDWNAEIHLSQKQAQFMKAEIIYLSEGIVWNSILSISQFYTELHVALWFSSDLCMLTDEARVNYDNLVELPGGVWSSAGLLLCINHRPCLSMKQHRTAHPPAGLTPVLAVVVGVTVRITECQRDEVLSGRWIHPLIRISRSS